MINILHCTPWPLGGATTYVVQLVKTLEVAKVPHRVLRLGKRTENKRREIGNFGVMYQNVAFDDARKAQGPFLLASSPTDNEISQQCAHLVEVSNGAYVFHDPNEFRIYPHWQFTGTEFKVICIREQGLKTMQNGMFIPHPYVRLNPTTPAKRQLAVSIARTSAVKNSDWILEANQKLSVFKQVVLKGEVNRMWWNFNVKPKHPEWPYPAEAGFARDYGAAVNICTLYDLMVDLTIFKNDGGGTQYSFLEAMDAGAVPVMTEDWCSYPGRARDFGFSVADSAALFKLLKHADKLKPEIQDHREANYTYLASVHNPHTIAAQYAVALAL